MISVPQSVFKTDTPLRAVEPFSFFTGKSDQIPKELRFADRLQRHRRVVVNRTERNATDTPGQVHQEEQEPGRRGLQQL